MGYLPVGCVVNGLTTIATIYIRCHPFGALAGRPGRAGVVDVSLLKGSHQLLAAAPARPQASPLPQLLQIELAGLRVIRERDLTVERRLCAGRQSRHSTLGLL